MKGISQIKLILETTPNAKSTSNFKCYPFDLKKEFEGDFYLV